MSARDPPNLRRWVGWGVKKAGKLGYRRKFYMVSVYQTVKCKCCTTSL